MNIFLNILLFLFNFIFLYLYKILNRTKKYYICFVFQVQKVYKYKLYGKKCTLITLRVRNKLCTLIQILHLLRLMTK